MTTTMFTDTNPDEPSPSPVIQRVIMMPFCLVFLLLGPISAFANPEPLTVDGFLAQVQHDHLGVKAAREGKAGAEARQEEFSLVYSPAAFSEVQYLNDQRQQINPALFGTKTVATLFKVGLQQQTRFGLKAKLATELDMVDVNGASPITLPMNQFSLGVHSLELTQSFLRNGFGSELRAQEAAAEAQNRAKGFSEGHRAKVLLVAAEASYWRLVAVREIVKVKTESLDRARRIFEWSSHRQQLDLGHKSDLLQADSAVKLSELELQGSRDDERSLAWAFNNARGLESEAVPETLVSLEAVRAGWKKPTRQGDREDLRALQQVSSAAEAQARALAEKNRPTLDLNTVLSLNAKAAGAGPAYGQAFGTDHPYVGVSLKFVLPLDFGGVDAMRAAYRREADAADLDYRQRRFEQDREWKDLERRYEEGVRRFQLASRIEEAQQAKYLNEKKRLDFGKTTTFHVLTFEQEYATAQLNQIRVHTDLLLTMTQMKLFAGAR